MRATRFDELAERAFSRIPAPFRRRLKNVAIVIEDEPSLRQLAAAGVGPGGTLLGLYEGRPQAVRSVSESFAMPDRITIFQGPHERIARDLEHLERLVEQTIWHEIAHHFGMDEKQVRTAERRRRLRKLWPH